MIGLLLASITAIGTATQEVNGNDTLFFFKDEIHLRADANVDWYNTEGTLIASNTNEIYPDDGGYYVVEGTVQSSPVYAFLYSEPDSMTITVTPDCENTLVHLRGNANAFTYTRPDGTKGTFARACTINYNALAWNTETWEDSAALIQTTLHEGNYTLPPLYGVTPISFCYDNDIRMHLGLDSACFETEILPDDIHAVKMELTSLATAREDDPAGNNERNRPISQDIIKASSSSDWSGPLEVAFYSNPTPGVKYYNWTIYKASDPIVTRQDQDIRYSFAEPGSYRIVCKVNNQYCTSDSMEMVVAISESYLAVPNVFTPNGDGVNDEFRVAYRSLREFHCWVYNRWGKLVYEWDDPAKGWDGMIGGRPASEGAYFYVIRAMGTDAQKDAKYTLKPVYNKKKLNADEAVIGVYQLSGDINLIRGK